MFERIQRGWSLAKSSWSVLKQDTELLIFPVVSGISLMAVFASFAVPLWSTGYFEALDKDQVTQNPLAWLVMFAFYFVNYFVIVFFNSALVACAIIRLEGGNPTVRDGFSAALARLPQIAGWAAVSATVGVILRMIESRSEKVGQIVSGLLGMAWSASTYFVVPVIVVEKTGPIDALKRSFGVMRKTWGESLTANFGIGLISMLLSIPAILAMLAGGYVLSSGNIAVGVILVVLGVGGLLTVSLISSTLHTIVLAALYLYASRGRVADAFDEGEFRQAFSKA